MPTTFQAVGASIGLSGKTLSRYTAYMLVRWAHKERELCSQEYCEYAKDWAKRFKEGSEYQESDSDGITVLKSIDGEEDGQMEEWSGEGRYAR